MATGDIERVLVTSLGKEAKETTYELHDRTVPAPLAPIALSKLLDSEGRRFHRAIAFCTPEAKAKTFPTFRSEVQADVVKSIDIEQSSGPDADEEFLEALTNEFPRRPAKPLELFLDLTQGPRHFALLTYVGALYLQALHGDRVRVAGAYYGFFPQRGRGRLFDLRRLLDLPRWANALHTYDETGSARGIADLLEDANRSLLNRLKDLSFTHHAGLPLELGRVAFELQKREKELGKALKQHGVPLAQQLKCQFVSSLGDVAKEPPDGAQDWRQGAKGRLLLDRAELERQQKFIHRLLDQGHDAVAVGLLREHIVNWLLWQLGRTQGWLEREVRTPAESALHTLRQLSHSSEPLTEQQAKLGRLWEQLTDERNALAHHGMRREERRSARKTREAVAGWDKVLSLPDEPSGELLPGGTEGRLLIAPCGMSPGSLYSALVGVRPKPDSLLVFCSEASEEGARRAVEQAGCTALDAEYARLPSPFGPRAGDRPERALEKLAEAHRRRLLDASEVDVCLTGGTTWMGLIVGRLATEARRLQRPTREFGLVDRRSPEEQRSKPFVAGELVWIVGGPDDGAQARAEEE